MMDSISSTPSHSVPHDTVHFSAEAIAGIASMDDFYAATGVMDILREREIRDVTQVWMNRTQCESLMDIVRRNAKKKHRRWSQHQLELAVSMDWLNYSPVSIPYVPEGEIWLFQSKEDADAAIEEYRAWLKTVEERKEEG